MNVNYIPKRKLSELDEITDLNEPKPKITRCCKKEPCKGCGKRISVQSLEKRCGHCVKCAVEKGFAYTRDNETRMKYWLSKYGSILIADCECCKEMMTVGSYCHNYESDLYTCIKCYKFSNLEMCHIRDNFWKPHFNMWCEKVNPRAILGNCGRIPCGSQINIFNCYKKKDEKEACHLVCAFCHGIKNPLDSKFMR